MNIKRALGWLNVVGGSISGATINIKEILVPDTAGLAAAQCSGTIINNFGMADANAVITLPAAAAGLNFLCVLGATRAGKYYRFLTLNAANDTIYLDGVAGSDDGYVQVASATIGNAIQFFAFQTAASAYDWYAVTVSGAWIAG